MFVFLGGGGGGGGRGLCSFAYPNDKRNTLKLNFVPISLHLEKMNEIESKFRSYTKT
jgi:hypothetical protein